jgi:hypothetical protein
MGGQGRIIETPRDIRTKVINRVVDLFSMVKRIKAVVIDGKVALNVRCVSLHVSIMSQVSAKIEKILKMATKTRHPEAALMTHLR